MEGTLIVGKGQEACLPVPNSSWVGNIPSRNVLRLGVLISLSRRWLFNDNTIHISIVWNPLSGACLDWSGDFHNLKAADKYPLLLRGVVRGCDEHSYGV